MQRSDSPARNIPGYWLGDPSSGWRWPFDATFTAWKVWALGLVPAFVALWLLLPLGVFLALSVRSIARWASPRLPLMLWRRKPRQGQLAGFFLLMLVLALVPNPRTWFLPLPWYLALLAAPLLSLFVTRAIMPWVTVNTPLSYWFGLLPRIASGPRARRAPQGYAPSFAVVDEAQTWHELELLALTIDPREVVMLTATPRVQPVEFTRWRPEVPDEAARTIAWAQAGGAITTVNADSLVLTVQVDVASRKPVYVTPGHVVYRDHEGRFSTCSPSQFEREFEVQA